MLRIWLCSRKQWARLTSFLNKLLSGEMKEMFQSRKYRVDEVTAASVHWRFCEPARLLCVQLATLTLEKAQRAQGSAEWFLSVWWRIGGTRGYCPRSPRLHCTCLWQNCELLILLRLKNKTDWQQTDSLSAGVLCWGQTTIKTQLKDPLCLATWGIFIHTKLLETSHLTIKFVLYFFVCTSSFAQPPY